MMPITPQAEHHWLQQLVGEWTYEGECQMGPGQPPMKSSGTEVVRSLGGLWTLGEFTNSTPEGQVATNIMTLGYDPSKKAFIGTFISSMMTMMWVYDGQLDASGKKLVLDTVGPNFMTNTLSKYQDIIEIIDENNRILSSQLLTEDGTWIPFMKSHYRRVTPIV